MARFIGVGRCHSRQQCFLLSLRVISPIRSFPAVSGRIWRGKLDAGWIP